MPIPDNEMSISIPVGRKNEIVQSPRYHFHNTQRGSDPFVIIQYTLSGMGAYQSRGRVWDVPPGHAFLCIVPEQSTYFFPDHATEPWRFAWLNLYGTIATSFCHAMRSAYGPVLPLPEHSSAAASFINFATQAEKRRSQDPFDATLAAFTFLLEWKHLLDRPQPRNTDPVETVMRICQVRFREPIGIKELAAQVGLTREHLTRIFTEKTGTSPARHLRELRIDAARKILKHSVMSLTEAARRCGFPSVKALQRALKSAKTVSSRKKKLPSAGVKSSGQSEFFLSGPDGQIS